MKYPVSQRALMWLMIVVVTAIIITIFSTPGGQRITSEDTLKLYESPYVKCHLSNGKCGSEFANIQTRWERQSGTQSRWQVKVKLMEKMYEVPSVVVAQFKDPKRPKWIKEFRLNKTGDRTYTATFSHPSSLADSKNYTTELTIETSSYIYSSRFRWIQ
jgi:hypothetical protein